VRSVRGIFVKVSYLGDAKPFETLVSVKVSDPVARICLHLKIWAFVYKLLIIHMTELALPAAEGRLS
jgi:hypothetical protein